MPQGVELRDATRHVVKQRLPTLCFSLTDALGVYSNNSLSSPQYMVICHYGYVMKSRIQNSTGLYLTIIPFVRATEDQDAARFHGFYLSHPLQELHAVGLSFDFINVSGGLSDGFG